VTSTLLLPTPWIELRSSSVASERLGHSWPHNQSPALLFNSYALNIQYMLSLCFEEMLHEQLNLLVCLLLYSYIRSTHTIRPPPPIINQNITCYKNAIVHDLFFFALIFCFLSNIDYKQIYLPTFLSIFFFL